MADINRDLERYLRKKRGGQSAYTGPSWFDRMFSAAEEREQQELTPRQKKDLDAMEHSIKDSEDEIERVEEIEEGLEGEQEARVGLYHQVMRFFRRKPTDDDVVETVEIETDDPTGDFRRLAEIQVRWLSRLPLRMRQAFKESEDYQDLIEIYERRGVAKKK